MADWQYASVTEVFTDHDGKKLTVKKEGDLFVMLVDNENQKPLTGATTLEEAKAMALAGGPHEEKHASHKAKP